MKLTSVLLLLVASFFAGPVLDTDGNPLNSGDTYYVNPAITDIADALTLASRKGTMCPMDPLGVAQARLRTSVLPVKFTPFDGRNGTIQLEEDVTILFRAITTCMQSTLWKVGADGRHNYVSTGGRERNPTELNRFRIRESRNIKTVYELFFPGAGGVPRGLLGIFVEDRRWLGIRNDRPFRFVFKKVTPRI